MKKLFLIISWSLVVGASDTAPVFRFHLKDEPHTLSPMYSTAGTTHYLLGNLYRGLIRFNSEGRLIFDLAEKCYFKTDLVIRCKLRKTAKWSTGTPITSTDVVQSFQNIMSPKSRCPAQEFLSTVKNAKKILARTLNEKELGIKKVDDQQFEFELEEADRFFLEKLSFPLLSIFQDSELPFEQRAYSGPYQIKSWVKGSKIVLKPNLNYPGNDKRPEVEVVFVGEDSSALSLFEKGTLSFLWRLPTEYIPKFKDSKDFLQILVDRYDYIGFNLRPGSPFQNLETRKAFAQSLDFEAWGKILGARGRPGCIGLSDQWILDSLCQDFKPGEKLNNFKPLTFWFSALGGDDLKRGAEWVQDQWKKNLGVKVQVKSMEQKSYLKFLRTTPPDIFRKGVSLEWPSCLSALENFETGNSENFVGYSNKEFDYMVSILRKKKLSQAEQASICRKASEILFKRDYVGIPMGLIHFSMLLRKEFSGVEINPLNHLNLSELSYNAK